MRIRNVFLIPSILLLIASIGFEARTRIYLSGAASTIVSANASDEIKLHQILAWIIQHPTRRSFDIPLFADRSPVASLNSEAALRICGSSVATFMGLSSVANLPTRRVLLLDDHFSTHHVVAQVLVSGNWIYVDPLLGKEIAPPAGPKTFIRLARTPLVGQALQSWMLVHYPNFGSSPWVSLILVRSSLIMMIFSLFLVALVLLTPPVIVAIRRYHNRERKSDPQIVLSSARQAQKDAAEVEYRLLGSAK